MATVNPFDLLGDDDNDDPSHLIAVAQQQKAAAAAAAKKPVATAASAADKPSAKLPSKPLPPAQAVNEAREPRNNAGPPRASGNNGGSGRGVPGRGRGGRGPPNRDYRGEYSNGFSGTGEADTVGGKPVEGEHAGYGGARQSYRGGRRGGYGSPDDSDRPRRTFERRSGTGRGYEVKRDGAGLGNWGTTIDEVLAQSEPEKVVNENDKVASPQKKAELEDRVALEGNKDDVDGAANETEKEPQDKEMTLEEYEKIKEEQRKALLARKGEERKVEPDQELQSMQQLSLKKGNDVYFIKLGSDKEKGRRKENTDQDEKAKKLSINEFLKPADGGRYYGGRGRGRGDCSFHGGYGGGGSGNTMAPSIEDPGQFPILGK